MEVQARFSLTIPMPMSAPSRSATDPKLRRGRKSPPSHSEGRSALERSTSSRGLTPDSGERSRLSDPDRLLGRTLAGKYRLDALLGEGAMGRIYQAHHVLLDKDVAIKVLHQHLGGEDRVAKRFHREARAASRLSHPNSVQILDFGGTDDGVLYIAMELLDGEDLQVILDHDFPFSPRRIVGILGQALRALDEAHHVGIVHRDLKPENIVVLTDRAGRDLVKVCDFGIAKVLESEGQSITVDGFVCGTPQYMAPEQARGEDIDRRLDIYAAGVVLYQMLVGSPPFSGDTALGTITKHLTEEAVPPRKRRPDLGIPESLERIAKKAMSKARADRYATAKEMADALEAALVELGPLADERLGEGRLAAQARSEAELADQRTEQALARSERPPPQETHSNAALPVRRTPWGMIVTGVAAIALVAALWWLTRPPVPPAPQATATGPISPPPSPPAEAAAPAIAPETPPPATPGQTQTGATAAIQATTSQATTSQATTSQATTSQATTSRREAPQETTSQSAGAAGHDVTRRSAPPGGPRPTPIERTTTETSADVAASPAAVVPLSPARRAFEEGRSAFLAQDFRTAIRSFEEAARLSPSDADVQKQLGRAYMRAGDITRGVVAYRRYLELAPGASDRAVIESIIAQHD
jgi:serine/threonine-protein kinase